MVQKKQRIAKTIKNLPKPSNGGRARSARPPFDCFFTFFDCFELFFDCFEQFLIVFEGFLLFSYFACISSVLLCFWPPALSGADTSWI